MISSPEASAAMLRKLNTVANCWKRSTANPATMPSRIRNVQVVVSVRRRRSTPLEAVADRRLRPVVLGLGRRHLAGLAHSGHLLVPGAPPVMAPMTCSMVVSAAR